jgi:hypothetical protein
MTRANETHDPPVHSGYLDGFDVGHDCAYKDVLEAMVTCLGYDKVLELLLEIKPNASV